MPLKLANIHVVEFSLSQNAFHIETLSEALMCNMKSAMARTQSDYQILAVCDSYEAASDICTKFKETFRMHDYSMFKDTHGNIIVK